MRECLECGIVTQRSRRLCAYVGDVAHTVIFLAALSIMSYSAQYHTRERIGMSRPPMPLFQILLYAWARVRDDARSLTYWQWVIDSLQHLLSIEVSSDIYGCQAHTSRWWSSPDLMCPVCTKRSFISHLLKLTRDAWDDNDHCDVTTNLLRRTISNNGTYIYLYACDQAHRVFVISELLGYEIHNTR